MLYQWFVYLGVLPVFWGVLVAIVGALLDWFLRKAMPVILEALIAVADLIGDVVDWNKRWRTSFALPRKRNLADWLTLWLLGLVPTLLAGKYLYGF